MLHCTKITTGVSLSGVSLPENETGSIAVFLNGISNNIKNDNKIWKYEGRSINKLQNGAIPSVLKVGKIRNIRFVGYLILNIIQLFSMMTSLL